MATICWATQRPRTYGVGFEISLARGVLALGHTCPRVFSCSCWSFLWWVMLALGCCHAQSLLQWVTLWLLVSPTLGHTHAQFGSVAQSCPALCNPMDPVHHQLPELAQTHALTTREANSLPHLESDNLSMWRSCVTTKYSWRANMCLMINNKIPANSLHSGQICEGQSFLLKT